VWSFGVGTQRTNVPTSSRCVWDERAIVTHDWQSALLVLGRNPELSNFE